MILRSSLSANGFASAWVPSQKLNLFLGHDDGSHDGDQQQDRSNLKREHIIPIQSHGDQLGIGLERTAAAFREGKSRSALPHKVSQFPQENDCADQGNAPLAVELPLLRGLV